MKKLSRLPNKWRKSKIKQSDFTETRKEDCPLPAPEIPLSATYHRSCKTLLLDPFIQAYCNNDLSGLVIAGPAINTDLQDAWNEIMFEYSGLIKSENSDYIFSLQKEIAILEHHIIYIDYTIPFLKLRYDEEIAQEVRDLGYELPQFTDKNYQRSLDLITSLAKTKVFEHSNLVEEYNRLNKTVEGKKQSEDEFISTVLMLSKYQGYDINTSKTTVYKFTQIFNNYLSEMKVKEKQLEKYGRG